MSRSTAERPPYLPATALVPLLQGIVNAAKAVTAALKQAGIALPAARMAAASVRPRTGLKVASRPLPAAVPAGELRDCKHGGGWVGGQPRLALVQPVQPYCPADGDPDLPDPATQTKVFCCADVQLLCSSAVEALLEFALDFNW